MQSTYRMPFSTLAALLFTLLGSSNLAAQQFETYDEAASDPFVVELLGEVALETLRQRELTKASQNGTTFAGDDTHKTYSDLVQTIRLMGDDFANHRWNPDKQSVPFDAAAFLLSIEKMKLIQKNSNFQNLIGSYRASLEGLIYSLNSDPNVFAWEVLQNQLTPNSVATKQIVESDFFVVPLVLREQISKEKFTQYNTLLNQLEKKYEASGGKPGTELAARFEEMVRTARDEAARWYDTKRKQFAKKANARAMEFRSAWYVFEMQPDIYMAARKMVIRLSSKANSEKNAALNGLKYARLNAEKAIEAAQRGDRANANGYLKSARQDAIEGLEAYSRLNATHEKIQRARRYMIPEAIRQTKLKQIATMSDVELKKTYDSLPHEGPLSVIRNCIGYFRNANQMVKEVRQKLEEAKQATAKCQPILESAEAKISQAFQAIAASKAAAAKRTFDVTSRQAFDKSMSELAKTLEPQDQVKFYQHWGKLIQAEIASNPTLMANESQYLAFIREHFEGKTARQVIED